jgi:tripartite-type tricarboxylate transporter receptor subunit TctC
MSFRAWILAAAIALLAPPALAQSYPSAPIRIVVPFPPGGGTDILARILAQKLNEASGQPAVVDNRAGAGGTIGSALVAKSSADGHTILIMPAGIAAHASLYKTLPYDPARDLAPVSRLASGPLVLVVHPSMPAKSIKEFTALAKKRPNEINFGSAGSGTLPHLSAELFNAMSGIRMIHIPYKGAGAAVTDLVAGRVPVYFMNILQSLSLINAGKLRALGVTTPQRTPISPDIPAIAEAGLPGYDMTNWYGMFVPAATPREVTAKLNAEVVRILQLPELKKRMDQDGMVVVASTPEQFREFFARETQKFGKVIETAGIKGAL